MGKGVGCNEQTCNIIKANRDLRLFSQATWGFKMDFLYDMFIYWPVSTQFAVGFMR